VALIEAPGLEPSAVREGLRIPEALPDVPRPASGVELLGPLAGSGYREPPWLVRRADGQMLQLTKVLYAVLEAIDGDRDAVAISTEVERLRGFSIEPEDIEFLVTERLQPLGVLLRPDGSEPPTQRANPLLGIRGRARIVNAQRTGRIARRFAPLFHPIVVAAVLVAFVATSWYVFVTEGMGPALHDLFHQPGALLAVIALTIVSAGFHEVGHASACQYGGATPGVMGAGLYIVWPAFYTDVSDSYRLSRAGRLRVDLGGLYFNAIFSVATFAAWEVTGWDPLLVLFALQLFQMARQLAPLVRFDGYHVLADLVGVPDLFGRIKPVLRGLIPIGRRDGARALKPWARFVITVWVLLVVPVLAFSMTLMVVSFPRLVATAAQALAHQWRVLAESWSRTDLVGVALCTLGMISIALPVLGVAYLITRMARRIGRRTWKATEGNARARRGLVLGAVVLALTLAVAWWPQGQYRPIQSDEQLTLPAITGWVAHAATGDLDLTDAVAADASLTQDTGPATALRDDVQEATAPSSASGIGGGHVFPDPPPPGEGDNQAHAVGYHDGRTVTDSATDLEWETDGSRVDNRNEAYALASCRGCRTSAVAFQVVLVVGQHDTVAPSNKAVARNELCVLCTTRALAVQLVLPLDAAPDADTRAAVEAIWSRSGQLDRVLRTQGFDAARRLVVGIEHDLAVLLQLDDDLAAAATTTTDAAATDQQVTTGGGSVTTAASGDAVTTTTIEPTTTTVEPTTASTEPSTSTSEPAVEPTSTTTDPGG
jgi:putative peptide zinc metalloprotease protein